MAATFDAKAVYERIKFYLGDSSCQIPSQNDLDDYPKFLKIRLKAWIDHYNGTIKPIVDSEIPFDPKPNPGKTVDARINKLSAGLIETVKIYYSGNVLKATECFNDSLKEMLFDEVKDQIKLEKDCVFYRGRIAEPGAQLFMNDLFHVPFNSRHFVSTNRFSIPGLPALYLGDTVYVCWEEFGRHRLRDIFFSRFSNTKELNVVRIQRFDDLLLYLDKLSPEIALMHLLRYLVLFPLTIACSISVKLTKAPFKPEYIIPQLLLQLITNDKELKIDGIMFPSTKVDYSKLDDVSAYNYVFPVKEIAATGYCSDLVDTFSLTNPTSLELEEVMYNPAHHYGMLLGSGPSVLKTIEIFGGVKSYYINTSFGKIEQHLSGRALNKIV